MLSSAAVYSVSSNFLSENGIIEEGGVQFKAGPSSFGSDRDALVVQRPDAETLRILDAVKDTSFRLSNIISRIRKSHEQGNDFAKAVTPESALMKKVFTAAALSCSRGDEMDPMKRDGPPLREWQDTYGEQLVIDQTMQLPAGTSTHRSLRLEHEACS